MASASKLAPQHVQGMTNDRLAAGPSPRTDRYLRDVLRNALGQALKWGLVACNVVRHFKAALDRAGLPDMRWHDLRHTCASLLLAMGTPARTVMDLLGHPQITLTMNTYAHLAPALERDAARALGAALAIGE